MVLDKQLLVEALSGRISLEEYHTMGSSGAGGSVGPGNPNMTNRAEQLDITWRDIIAKMEALWSIDIMNMAPEIYDKAAGALDEIRNLDPASCRAAATNFKQITQLLAHAASNDEFSDEKDLKLCMARQEELNAELEYVCDEFDPDVPRPPEQPVKSREQWVRAKSKDRKHGMEPPEKDEVGSDLGIDNALPAGDVPPERSFVPDRSTLGPDQAGETPGKKATGKKPEKSTKNSGKSTKNSGKPPKKSEKPTGKPKKKPVKESQADACPSVVMASLAEAAEAADEKEAVFLQAGDAIRACLEAYTDVDSAYVEIGQAVPGYRPRLDLHTEWTVQGKPSPCQGYARLHLDENEGLVVMGADDRTRDVIRFDEEETDEAIAWRLYHALDEVYDVTPRATWEENRVVPALFMLLERARRGASATPEMFREALSGLNGFVALHEAVAQPSTSVTVVQEGFEDVYAYHYAWAVNTPLGHARLPDEISPHKQTMDDPPPEDEEAEGQKGEKGGYIGSAPVKDAGGDDEDIHWQFAVFGEALDEFLQDPNLDEKYRTYLQGKRERMQGGHTSYWRTPTVLIDLGEGTVKIRHRDDTDEPIDPDTKDEDITAKLATYSFQKESVETSRLIEYFDRERLSLTLIPGMKKTYLVRYRGKILGSVKSDGRKWGTSVRKRGPWKDFTFMSGYAAGQALAKNQGIHEKKKVDSRLIKKLSGMETPDLVRAAEVMGVKVHGDGVTFDRQKLQAYILAAAAGTDPCNLPAQVGFEESATPEAAMIAACEAVEMRMDLRTAKSWVEQHWKEYL